MKNILVITGPISICWAFVSRKSTGAQTYEVLLALIGEWAEELDCQVECFQSNHEGDIVDEIQEAYGQFDGIVINPAAYTTQALRFLDALKAVAIPAVEVHISDINTREAFRQISYAGQACEAHFIGLGFDGYKKALEYLAAR